MKILVVDDEQPVRESLRRSLRFNGYDVLTASDGLEAVEAVRSENPELLILDVMMPNMDGLEVCRTLRSEGWDRPILVLTARDGVSDRVAGLDAGADDYLPKPFALEELKILEEVWGYDFPTSGNALEVYIGYLRKKTEGDGDSRLIHTVRGVGYVLRESHP